MSRMSPFFGMSLSVKASANARNAQSVLNKDALALRAANRLTVRLYGDDA